MTKSESKSGENNPKAKLTSSIVYCLRVLQDHCSKPNRLDLSIEFDVHPNTIKFAVAGDTWQRVPLYFRAWGYNKSLRIAKFK